MKTFRTFAFRAGWLVTTLCLCATLGAWADSHRTVTKIDTSRQWIEHDRDAHTRRLAMASFDGELTVYYGRFQSDEARYLRHYRQMLDDEANGGAFFSRTFKLTHPNPLYTGLIGLSGPVNRFGWRRWSDVTPSTQTRYFVAEVPYWTLAVMFAVFPSIGVIRWWRARRFPAGSCPTCGYDLRASRDRCPECGRAIDSTILAGSG